MADPPFSISISGGDALNRLLAGVVQRTGDLSPIFRGPIDKSVTMMEKAQFATKGEFGGRRWAELRPSTKAARPRPGGNRGGIDHPLWDTGAGKASLEKVGPNSFREITRSSYERGSTLPRMALHQVGYTITQWGGRKLRHPRRVPARPVVPNPIPEFVQASWAVMLEAYIAGPTGGGISG